MRSGELASEIRTDWLGRKFMFTKDPDGQTIELKEKTHESEQGMRK